jgi:uncharacterized membrane protein (UPF0127 family)
MNVIDLSFSTGETWEVYVALTPEQRSRGLADLEAAHLDADGMLFCYPNGSWVPFTAEKMRFDMCINWYGPNGEAQRFADVPAGASWPICSAQQFWWVLESPHSIPSGDLKVRHA